MNIQKPWVGSSSINKSGKSHLTSNLTKNVLKLANSGVPSNKIYQQLLTAGFYPHQIREAMQKVAKLRNRRELNWSSPTAIQNTARMIRKDLFYKRLSNQAALKILRSAYKHILAITHQKRDKKRLQMKREVQITLNLIRRMEKDNMMRQLQSPVGRATKRIKTQAMNQIAKEMANKMFENTFVPQRIF
jgi:hypothetical protein